MRSSGLEGGEVDGDEGERGRRIAELRERIDGFTPERQRTFLDALRETGCVRDAARVAGVSTTTIDRARRNFPDFDADCRTVRNLAVPALEAIAYRRATVGAAARIIRNGRLFEVRVKPSDSMLRLLLAGAAPERYGRRIGHDRLTREEKSRIEREVRAEIEAVPKWCFDKAMGEIEKALEIYRLRRAREREEAGGDDPEGGGDA